MGEIKAELNAELQTHIAFEIPLFGGIPVPESAVVKLGDHSCADPACHLADARTAQASRAAADRRRDAGGLHQQFLPRHTGRQILAHLRSVPRHGRPVSCAGEHGRSVRHYAADQRPERHRRSGDHERPADLRLAVPVPRSARRTEKSSANRLRSSRRSTLWRSAFGLCRSACDCSATFSPDSSSWSWSKWPFRSLSPFH